MKSVILKTKLKQELTGRGCLGVEYMLPVILPEFPDDNYLNIIDSKKLNRKKRNEMRRYIESVAIDYGVDYAEPEEIDKKNILQATLSSMHRSLDKLTVLPSNIIVDGTNFKMYTDREKQAITHQLIKGGDAKYHNRSCSIYTC